MSVGLEIPETRINKENPPFYVLPPRYISLGAYPVAGTLTGVHSTYRKGMREFNHDDFSRLYLEENKANFQLHTWEYLIAEELVGYVVAESTEGLEHFQDLEKYGCKLGKEGFAVVTEVSPIMELQRQTVAAMPSTIVAVEALLEAGEVVGGCDIYNLYRYQWESNAKIDSDREGFLDLEPSLVNGFVPFVGAYFSKPVNPTPRLDYYTNQEIYIPVSLVNLLRG